MADGTGNLARDHLRAFIERIERLEEEKATLMEDIREIYAEAKGTGFDPKIMRQVVRIRKIEPDQRQEQEYVLDTYLSALGMLEHSGEEKVQSPEVAEQLGLLKDNELLGKRTKRFAAIVENQKITTIFVDEKGIDKSSAENILKSL